MECIEPRERNALNPMQTATFCSVAQQFYPVDAPEYSQAEIDVLDAMDDLENVENLSGWDEDGDIATVAAELIRIQSVIDENWLVMDGLDLDYRKVSDRIRSELAAIEITDTDSDGNVIVVGYCNPYLDDSSASEDDEF